ncbi:hypothetical protein REB14_02255 [Chryseobacterium sp. ES2]|uniref:TrbL/VirB6 plasmid conjugal transfer protein n=1 Tax=Chryseobacterium metallicongregator TaxID=3073042 RepID=A0ABU1DZN4_9FLAO|nr:MULTISPECIES: hypothetical protein [Chryseobacterium]MDR4951003.1 hypothetical protein [Chryseobacterium sp. ES2]
MTIDEILNQYRTILKTRFDLYINESKPYVLLIAVTFTFVFVGYKVMKAMADPDEKIGRDTLLRPILTLMAITLYIPLVKLLLFDTVDILSDIVKHGAYKVTGRSAADFEQAFQTSITHVQGTGADGNGVYDVLQINPFLELLHIIIYFLASVAGGYILLRQLLMIFVYYVLGIFVLPFSLIVSNERILKSWFFGFLSILLWEPILTILKVMIVLLPVDKTEFTNVLLSIALQLVMIFMVLKVPHFANLLVDPESGNKFGNKTGSVLRGLPGKAFNALKSK